MFTDAYKSIWANYKLLKSQQMVIRSGAGLYGAYAYDPDNPREPRRSESDLEHVGGAMILATQISAFFPKIIPSSELLKYLLLLMHHEIYETTSGDVPDDGRRDEKAKNKAEFWAIVQYCKTLPKDVDWQLELAFLEMQTRQTEFGQIVYGIDKLDALLEGLIFESEGRGGLLDVKAKSVGPSERDLEAARITGSNRQVDIWSVRFLDVMRKYSCSAVFEGILRAAVMDVRGEWFTWAK